MSQDAAGKSAAERISSEEKPTKRESVGKIGAKSMTIMKHLGMKAMLYFKPAGSLC